MVLRSLFAAVLAPALPAFAGAAEPTPPKGFTAIFNGTALAALTAFNLNATKPVMRENRAA